MDMRDLEAFVAVVRNGGFRAAGQALFISQPSLTRRVQNLEAHLGVKLLDRSSSGTRLTAHGEALFKGASRIVTTVDEVEAATVGLSGQTIRLGAAATAAGSFLAPFLSRWIPDHPDSRIILIEDGSVRLKQRLAQYECDVALVAIPLSRDFDHRPVTRIALQALFPPTHRLGRSSEPISVSELHGEPLLLNGSPFLATDLLMSACRLAGVYPEVVYECSNGQTLAALAESGLGIAILADNVDLRGFDLPTRLVHRDGELLEFELHVAWLRERHFSPLVHEFINGLSAATRPAPVASG